MMKMFTSAYSYSNKVYTLFKFNGLWFYRGSKLAKDQFQYLLLLCLLYPMEGFKIFYSAF